MTTRITKEAQKQKRDVRTFEPETDVARMLDRASLGGVKLRFLCNAALRAYLTQKGYARKKDETHSA